LSIAKGIPDVVPAGEVTTSRPLAAVGGTGIVSELPSEEMLVGATGASAPKVTVEPGPNPPPVTVTCVPGCPNMGTRPIDGATAETKGDSRVSGNVKTARFAPPTDAAKLVLVVPGLMLAPAVSANEPTRVASFCGAVKLGG
jgi:hypothetical protein